MVAYLKLTDIYCTVVNGKDFVNLIKDFLSVGDDKNKVVVETALNKLVKLLLGLHVVVGGGLVKYEYVRPAAESA